jgi:hypothetical protein
MGLQGYSTPTPHTVIFSTTSPGLLAALVVDAFPTMFESIVSLRGSYKGQEEDSYALPKPVFDELARRWPYIVTDQESFLVLGTPRSMNRRPAHLVYTDGRPDEDIGMFYSVSKAVAMQHEAWTHNPATGDYWICEVDPPDSIGTAKERALKAKADAYDTIMSLLPDSYSRSDMQPQDVYDPDFNGVAQQVIQQVGDKVSGVYLVTGNGEIPYTVPYHGQDNYEAARWLAFAEYDRRALQDTDCRMILVKTIQTEVMSNAKT